jgi:hypothetical protein
MVALWLSWMSQHGAVEVSLCGIPEFLRLGKPTRICKSRGSGRGLLWVGPAVAICILQVSRRRDSDTRPCLQAAETLSTDAGLVGWRARERGKSEGERESWMKLIGAHQSTFWGPAAAAGRAVDPSTPDAPTSRVASWAPETLTGSEWSVVRTKQKAEWLVVGGPPPRCSSSSCAVKLQAAGPRGLAARCVPQACLQGHPVLSKLETSTTWLALETTQEVCCCSGTQRGGSWCVACSAKLELELELGSVCGSTHASGHSLTLTLTAADCPLSCLQAPKPSATM